MDQTYGDYMIQVPHHVRMMYTAFLAIIMVIGVVGNGMVITVILNTKEMRNSTYIFLANLAVADFLTLLIWGAQALFDVNSKRLMVDRSETMCKSLPFLEDSVAYASVLTILAISFERYYAVCQPLKAAYICTKKRAYRLCLFAWALAVLFSSPLTLHLVYLPSFHTCTIVPNSFFKKSYVIASPILFFFLPLIILVVVFFMIARQLIGAVALDVNPAHIRQRHHVVTMLATVVLCFFLCQLPYRVLSFLFIVAQDELYDWLTTDEFNNLWFFCRSMIYLHSAANPILYSLMSKRFRAGFKNICCCSERRKGSFEGMRVEVTNTTTTLTCTSSN